MSRPTFVCVPGFCHTPDIFEPLKTLLGHYGYPVLPVQLPSVLVNGSHASNDPAQDTVAIRSLVSHLVEAGQDVIVILHSYAGVPGGDALQGLGKDERVQSGRRGGVLRIIFVMAWIVQEGFKMCEEGDYSSFPPYMHCNTTSRVSHFFLRMFKPTTFPNISKGSRAQRPFLINQTHSYHLFLLLNSSLRSLNVRKRPALCLSHLRQQFNTSITIYHMIMLNT